jgi:hypothetical protein
VAPSAGPVLPEFVAVSSDTGLRLRTLVLRVDPRGRVAYSVLRDTDPLIGASELAVPPAAQRALNLTVATLTAPYGGSVQNQGRSLAQLGIGYVLLPTPINPDLARLLDGVPGLRPVSQTAEFALWRVSDTTARVRVVERSGTVVPVNSGTVRVAGASVPAAGGTLELAERGRLVRDAQRASADSARGAGGRLGAGVPPASRRRVTDREPQPAQPDRRRRAGSPRRGDRDRARPARRPDGR